MENRTCKIVYETEQVNRIQEEDLAVHGVYKITPTLVV